MCRRALQHARSDFELWAQTILILHTLIILVLTLTLMFMRMRVLVLTLVLVHVLVLDLSPSSRHKPFLQPRHGNHPLLLRSTEIYTDTNR